MGVMIVGMKEETAEDEGEVAEEGGIMATRVRTREEEWTVVALYVTGDMKKKLERIREWLEKQTEKERVIVGREFNARTGIEGGREGEDEERSRESKDRKTTGEGRKLVRMLGEAGWEILNVNIAGDEEGEFTYTGGKGKTVIDYVLGDGNTRRRIEG